MPTCPKCASTDLFAMPMEMTGQRVLFAHCRACENRWWVREGDVERLSLDQVLGG